MNKEKEVLAIIPGRAGSKGIKNKTIAKLNGKSLLEHAAITARSVSRITRIIVSTDCPLISSHALELGLEVYQRPASLASDDSLVADAIRDLLQTLKQENYHPYVTLLLEATSFRTASDINKCLDNLQHEEVDSVATFCEVSVHPSKIWDIDDQGTPSQFIDTSNAFQNRQSLRPYFNLNGGCYAFKTLRLPSNTSRLLFGNQRTVIMPALRSFDINTPDDLKIAELLFPSFYS